MTSTKLISHRFFNPDPFAIHVPLSHPTLRSVAAHCVPGERHLPVPAHSRDHYEEGIYGIDGVPTPVNLCIGGD